MKPLGIGVVGCGVVTQEYILPHFTHHDVEESVRLVAVCDTDAARAEDVGRRWQADRWFDDYEAMLADHEIDAILVATPIPAHYEQAKASLLSGKHTYVQKTMTHNLAEATELIEIAEADGLILAASPGQMLSVGYRRIADALRDGALGKLFWAFGTTAFTGHEDSAARIEAGIAPTWFYKSGGGPMADMGSYTLHALTGILGPAISVSGSSQIALPTRTWRDQTITVDADDNTVFMLEFAEGFIGVAGSHYCQRGDTLGWGFLGFYGSEGALEIKTIPGTSYPGDLTFTGVEDFVGAIDPAAPAAGVSGTHAEILSVHVWADIVDFVSAIAEHGEPIASARHARHVIEIIEKGYEAASTGRRQLLSSTF